MPKEQQKGSISPHPNHPIISQYSSLFKPSALLIHALNLSTILCILSIFSWFSLPTPIHGSPVPPSFSPIQPSILQSGTKILVQDSTPKSASSAVYSITYASSILNAKLVLGTNSLSMIGTNSGATSIKYFLCQFVSGSSTGFSARLIVFTSNTYLYSTALSYIVYNSLDASLVQPLQLRSLYFSLLIPNILSSAQNFYFGDSYYSEQLTLPSSLSSPPISRFSSPQTPTCSVFLLGFKIQSISQQNLFLSSNCTAQYGSDKVDVYVMANQGTLVDTYVGCVMVFVRADGRWVGYGEDGVGIGIGGGGTANFSQEILMVGIVEYNPLSVSQYKNKIATHLPELLTTISQFSTFFALTSFYSPISTLFRHLSTPQTASSPLSLSFLSTSSSFFSYSSSYPSSNPSPYIHGYNTGFMLILSIVSCSSGGYYDRIGGLCYGNGYWTGGQKICGGMGLAQQIQGTGGTGGFWVDGDHNAGVFFGGYGDRQGIWEVWNFETETVEILGSNQQSNITLNTTQLTFIPSQSNSFLISNTNLYYLLKQANSSQIMLIDSLSYQAPSLNASFSNTSTLTPIPIDASIVDLDDMSIKVEGKFYEAMGWKYDTGRDGGYWGWDTVYGCKIAHVLNQDFQIVSYLLIPANTSTANTTNTTNTSSPYTAPFSLHHLSTQSCPSQTIPQQIQANLDQTNTTHYNYTPSSPNNTNNTVVLTISDIMETIKKQFGQENSTEFEGRKWVRERVKIAVSRIHCQVQENWDNATTSNNGNNGNHYGNAGNPNGANQANNYTDGSVTYRVEEMLQVIVDNYVFLYNVTLKFLTYPNTSNFSCTVISSSCTLLNSLSIPLFPSTSPTPTISHIHFSPPSSLASIPPYIPLSSYSYLQCLYSSLFYTARQQTLYYTLSNGYVSIWKSRVSGLEVYYDRQLGVDARGYNQTVNFTQIFGYGDRQGIFGDLNASGSGYADAEYIQNRTQYDFYYRDGTLKDLYQFVEMGVDVTMNSKSVMLSQLGDQGYFGQKHVDPSSNPGSSNLDVLILHPNFFSFQSQTSPNPFPPLSLTSSSSQLFIVSSNLLYIFSILTSPTQNYTLLSNFSIQQSYKIERVIDLERYLQLQGSGASNGIRAENLVIVSVNEGKGIVYVISDKGRMYEIDCGWGQETIGNWSVYGGREFMYRFVQLNIPVYPPVINNTNITNQTNSTNSTDNSTTPIDNSTNSSNSSNSTFPPTPVPPTPIPSSQPTPQSSLSQTAIILISTLSSITGIAAIAAIYFLFIKPKAVVRVNPEMATRTHIYNNSKGEGKVDDFTQIAQKMDRMEKIQRVSSGKTQAGSLMEFQSSSQNSLNTKISKMKKLKKDMNEMNQLRIQQLNTTNNLNTISSRDGLRTEDARGLIQDKSRNFVIEDLDI